MPWCCSSVTSAVVYQLVAYIYFSLHLLYWYECTNTDAGIQYLCQTDDSGRRLSACRVYLLLIVLALLVRMYKYWRRYTVPVPNGRQRPSSISLSRVPLALLMRCSAAASSSSLVGTDTSMRTHIYTHIYIVVWGHTLGHIYIIV